MWDAGCGMRRRRHVEGTRAPRASRRARRFPRRRRASAEPALTAGRRRRLRARWRLLGWFGWACGAILVAMGLPAGGAGAALRHSLQRRHLRRIVPIALVAGVVLTAINVLDVIVSVTQSATAGKSRWRDLRTAAPDDVGAYNRAPGQRAADGRPSRSSDVRRRAARRQPTAHPLTRRASPSPQPNGHARCRARIRGLEGLVATRAQPRRVSAERHETGRPAG